MYCIFYSNTAKIKLDFVMVDGQLILVKISSYTAYWQIHYHSKGARIGILELSLHYQPQEDETTWRWYAFLGNISVTMYDLI